MGEVFRPEDIAKGRKRLLREAVKDLNPGVRDAVVGILESWEGVASEKKLVSLLGKRGTKSLLDRMREFPR